jgi:hypothetical protein
MNAPRSGVACCQRGYGTSTAGLSMTVGSTDASRSWRPTTPSCSTFGERSGQTLATSRFFLSSSPARPHVASAFDGTAGATANDSCRLRALFDPRLGLDHVADVAAVDLPALGGPRKRDQLRGDRREHLPLNPAAADGDSSSAALAKFRESRPKTKVEAWDVSGKRIDRYL